MGDAYTPGLLVAADIDIAKQRRLPLTGNVLVKCGDAVTAGDVVARTELPGRVHLMNLASKLGVLPSELADTMLIGPGDKIEKGAVIASRKVFFGLATSTVESPIEGTLESVSSKTGQLILREPPVPVEVTAYIDGTISDIITDEGVVVSARGALIQGIFGLGGERTAPIVMRSKTRHDPLEASDITPDDKGKILVGGARLTLQAAKQAMACGVAGVVCGGFAYQNVRDLLGYDVGVAVTGSEDIPTTLVLTEGFGDIAMAEPTFELLSSLAGRTASINGATQIRAGVIRPEVVVPLKEQVDDIEASTSHGLEIGAKVRCIRAPYFGHVGEVVAMPVELTKLASETMVRVVKVKMEDGTDVDVPRANVELIQR